MSVIGPRPGLWNQDILTAERDKYNANDVKPGLAKLAKKLPVFPDVDNERSMTESGRDIIGVGR